MGFFSVTRKTLMQSVEHDADGRWPLKDVLFAEAMLAWADCMQYMNTAYRAQAVDVAKYNALYQVINSAGYSQEFIDYREQWRKEFNI